MKKKTLIIGGVGLGVGFKLGIEASIEVLINVTNKIQDARSEI